MASVSKFLLLVLMCSFHTCRAAGDDDRTHKVLSTASVKTDAGCSDPKATPSSGGATVPLRSRHGPCSQLLSKKAPTLEEMLPRDQLRASYIQRKFSGAAGGNVQQSAAAATVPTALGSSLDSLEYVITIGIGSPAVTQTVLIDTGSDVSWVQCKPCAPPQCHPQADPLFDPSASSTYSAFPCTSDACAQLGVEGIGCSSSQCQYIVQYGDGSNTTGTYSSDTLTLGSTAVESFQFGCSHADSGLLQEEKMDGLMGLGGGAQSLVSQTAATFGTAFSYCLPATANSSGFLTLGADISGFTATTPMLRSSSVPTFYGVVLKDIMVGGQPLGVPPSAFAAGSIMDSGTVLSRLPPTAYSALSSAFKAGMQQYPAAPPIGILDTCFDFTGLSTVTIPSVALVFSGGVVVDLDPNGIIINDCLAFVATDDDSSTGFIGNVQQRTFEVLYDVGGSTVGFKAGAC